MVEKIMEGVTSWWSDVKAKGGEIIDKLKEGIKNAISNLKTIGKDIIDGLWQGIQDNWTSLVENIKSKFRSLFSNIKELLGGISSPSRLFAEGDRRTFGSGHWSWFSGRN